MSKIDLTKLTFFLNNTDEAIIVLSFEEIENIIESFLPPNLKEQSKWWWNSKNNPEANGWLLAGYKTIKVAKSIKDKQIVFEKINRDSSRVNYNPTRIIKWFPKNILPVVLFIFTILIVIISFRFNKEYDLFFGILSMIAILTLTLSFTVYLLYIVWKNSKSQQESKTKIFFSFLNKQLLLALLTTFFGIVIVAYAIPLVIPNEYTIKCINFTYTGYVMNSNADGLGKVSKWNGDIVEGTFKNGKIHGNGKYTYKNGEMYEGNFVANKMHGDGVYTFNNGNVYSGEFTRGEITGYGVINLPTGESYTGEVQQGQRSGKGVLETTNGCRYDGYWKNDDKHGKGTMHFPNGDRYGGIWEYGFIKHGSNVRFTYSDGKTTERYMYAFAELVRVNGDIISIEKIDDEDNLLLDEFDKYDQENYSPDIIDGDELKYYANDEKGVYLFRILNTDCLNGYNEVVFWGNNKMGFGGHQYTGEFYNGTFHGEGTLFITDGNSNVIQTYQGDFIDGLRHGHGILTSNDGDRFEGVFLNDEPNGYGVYYHENGIIDEGKWNADWKCSGYGSTKIDGIRYEGTWESGHLTGYGRIIDKNGTEKKIIWPDDGSTFKALE